MALVDGPAAGAGPATGAAPTCPAELEGEAKDGSGCGTAPGAGHTAAGVELDVPESARP